MCEKGNPNKIDKCMRNCVNFLNLECTEFETLACCCGHGKYPMTIIVRDKLNNRTFELMSGKTILRKKRFYKKDGDGDYYIPEVIKK